MNLKKRLLLLLLLIILLPCVGCSHEESIVDATKYGVLPTNSGLQNSENLQKLIDELSVSGGEIYIPTGEYEFAENGTQTIGSHCIKMRSNVSLTGDGEQTVLMPVGHTQYGMDMFYFNDYLDLGQANYLENCSFENFVIDASGTSCAVYTSAGKGFMLNLFRNCHWKNVMVRYTDATGFGVDCPMDSSITNCTAIGCGKAATSESTGASGFGIGYGYAPGEHIEIRDCTSRDHAKFGFFFEHQGRFDPQRYDPQNQGSFVVIGCDASGNLYNFGGIRAENVTYRQCTAADAIVSDVHFENCRNCYYNDESMPGR